MTVRAKFYVHAITNNMVPTGSDEVSVTVQMSPVFASLPDNQGNAVEENRIFGKWSPSDSLQMQIRNPAAAAQFELGKSYYLDFTPADTA
jgi:hypothetical protein